MHLFLVASCFYFRQAFFVRLCVAFFGAARNVLAMRQTCAQTPPPLFVSGAYFAHFTHGWCCVVQRKNCKTLCFVSVVVRCSRFRQQTCPRCGFCAPKSFSFQVASWWDWWDCSGTTDTQIEEKLQFWKFGTSTEKHERTSKERPKKCKETRKEKQRVAEQSKHSKEKETILRLEEKTRIEGRKESKKGL